MRTETLSTFPRRQAVRRSKEMTASPRMKVDFVRSPSLTSIWTLLTTPSSWRHHETKTRPPARQRRRVNLSEHDSSDDKSSEDESSDDETLEDRVRCTFCGLVMTRRVFNHQTTASSSEHVISPASACVPRCKLCCSPTLASPLARPDNQPRDDFVEQMPLDPRFAKDVACGNIRKYVIRGT
ncbi:hypothetical protein BaRGS_00034488 [Batillaria attramentaria]|uniref:Uncharacterized protein n=1 Tax=Batillaria attramentaria TaxID=370345 RepID=A0ABD0JH66_9CAEN